MKLAITICATKLYTYALVAQARRVQAAILQCPQVGGGIVILVGDDCEEMGSAEALYRNLLPDGWETRRIIGLFTDGLKNYSNAAQLIIARMRSAAFSEARKLGVDLCLSLDSDVLPQPNSLACMVQSLGFDDGYYGVATCPYPSQGGGDFLAGRGTPRNPICPDVYDDERMLPQELKDRIAAHQLIPPGKESDEERKLISEEIKKATAKGDVFFLNSRTGVRPFADRMKAILADHPALIELMEKEISENWKANGFRQRGWISAAYPALGKGCVLPTDWCGFGCTLMGRKALALAQFDGYDGSGTEDLYIVWKRWHRNNIRINTIPHAPADHVIRDTKEPGKFILMQAYHEASSECVDHLRVEARPWFQQTEGESPTQ